MDKVDVDRLDELAGLPLKWRKMIGNQRGHIHQIRHNILSARAAELDELLAVIMPRVRELERIEAAVNRIASLSMSQFANASDMAGECVNVAREALTGGKDGN